MNLLEIAILFIKVVQIERAPQTGASAAYDNDVCGGDHQKDANAAAARQCVLQREGEKGREVYIERDAYIEQLFIEFFLTRTASQHSFSAQQFCLRQTMVPHSRQMELSLGTL